MSVVAEMTRNSKNMEDRPEMILPCLGFRAQRPPVAISFILSIKKQSTLETKRGKTYPKITKKLRKAIVAASISSNNQMQLCPTNADIKNYSLQYVIQKRC